MAVGCGSMDRYYQALANLEKSIDSLDTKTANELLDKLFCIKPVRLKWYLIKAQVMLKEGIRANEIISFLISKCGEPWYPYDNVEEYFKLLIKLSELSGDLIESERYKYKLNKLMESFSGVEVAERARDEEWQAVIKRMSSNMPVCYLDIIKMADLNYIRGDIYLYIVWQALAERLFPAEKRAIRKTVLSKYNAEFYYEHLKCKSKENFVVIIEEKEEILSGEIIVKALKLLGKEAHMLKIRPGEEREIFSSLDNIASSSSKNCMMFILASGTLTEKMLLMCDKKGHFERLTEADNEYQEENIAVSRYGKYLDYIADIYHTSSDEITKALYKKANCRFSIMIPCRNISRALYYTLKTCLNQSFQGAYEIIVSDNTDSRVGCDTPVYRICQELNDARIKYFRTPTDFPLAKNYEYAFLKSSGEFLFSIGADDGILPWCLEELDAVLDRYPTQKIFLWHESVYQWPGVEKCFVGMPGMATLKATDVYKKGSFSIQELSTKSLFNDSFYDYGVMYYLPQLYHNSGIRREYMAELLDKTGVLWGGINQDISMAITIGNLEDSVYFIDNPLVINGVSDNSIGSLNAEGVSDLNHDEVRELYRTTEGRGG